jgi:hypothetical protein
MTLVRTYRAGSAVEDYCRACKTDRMHTVVAADGAGHPLRVVCGYCRSEHNYRGGPRVAATGPSSDERETPVPASAAPRDVKRPQATADALPLVSERERTGPPLMSQGTDDLELLLRRIIREETGLTPAAPSAKWRGGSLVLKPGTPGLQEKSWPIETFFHKIVMLRNRLRTLEQQVNASEIPDDQKLKIQSYISGCYGSLTSFNVLFADESDQFKGSGE